MSAEAANPYCLGIDRIQRYLPHKSPFLLVDRVLEIHPNGSLDDMSPANMVGTRVLARKNVSFNEPYFQGHFPGFSVLPGVLVIETMAQVASFSLYPYLMKDPSRSLEDFGCILVGVDGARFRRPVVPGDTLLIETVVAKCRGRLWQFDCTAKVDGHPVAEAQIMANLLQNKGELK